MKLCTRTTDTIDADELRTLLIDAANELTGGESRLLEARLPWDGYPILLADAQYHPVLVSFDPINSQAALLNGLRATEQVATALPWLNQVYDALQKQLRPPRLMVVSYDPPPGAEALLAGCPDLKLFGYKVVRIRQEAGLLLEPVAAGGETGRDRPAEREAPVVTTAKEERPRTGPVALPSLSEEEKNYFRQL
ncbi:MAG TPA: hypothetical protein ENK49_13115 [Gammaproteobacteria bacterium]|nr:hypothetical protein [Gammaproteobacteria bacterium]